MIINNKIPQYYLNYDNYLKNRYNKKVWKISIDAGFTCPNRDGTFGINGCIFCNNKAYTKNTFYSNKSIEDQIKSGIDYYKKYRKAEKFIVYFQSYTNTYAPLDILKQKYDTILSFNDIVGISIGTRPDCVNDEILDLIKSYSEKLDIWIEYGLQTIHNKTLNLIKRGHNYETFLKAIKITKRRNILVCVHVIIGLPGETKNDILKTAIALSRIGIDGIKFHPLHVVKNTVIEEMYNNSQIKILDLNDYIDIVCDFIEILPKNVVIQRLTADVNKELLIEPEWCSKKRKMEVIRLINEQFHHRKSYQGLKYN